MKFTRSHSRAESQKFERYTPLTFCTCLDLMADSVTSSKAKVLDKEAIPYIKLMAMAKPVLLLQIEEKKKSNKMTKRQKNANV